MLAKLLLKRVTPTFLLKIWRRFRYKKVHDTKLTDDQLLSSIKHEAHRIEKAVYNNIFESNYKTYRTKKNRLEEIFRILYSRGYKPQYNIIDWASRICDSFDDLESSFISIYSKKPEQHQLSELYKFNRLLQFRRSVRVWSQHQPDDEHLEEIALKLIDAARWAPTSGNRQPWRFKILINEADKSLLAELKENHCTSAPGCIFIGMDKRLYGAFSDKETGIYIDAGAAIQNMILCAHSAGLGTCWNHFAIDLILSRESNAKSFVFLKSA